MVKRSTLVMVVILALIAGLAYYMQQPDNLIKKAQTANNTPTAEALGSLIPMTDGPVNSLTIQKTAGESVKLTRNSSGWAMSLGGGSPIPADQSVAEQVTSATLYLSLAGKIGAGSANLSAFGLDKPAYTFTVSLANSKTATFKIGNATVAEDGYYVQKEDGTVVILDKNGFDQVLNLLQEPPYMFTLTPTATSEAGTATPTPTSTMTAAPGAATPTGTVTVITELTPTKQP